ncbi:MAG TPA: glyoxalase superfamily protein [Bryobacteraceae bacterium]|nr:glyoxalase superfamily protein [Bryobacteraceae bacterium]
MKPTTFESISPIFAVADLPRSLAFYCDLLGFEPAWTWGKPPQLAAICRDKVEITLMDRADKPEGQARVYLRVTGIATLYAALERAGADIVVPIADRAYGLRDFRVRDPSGNELDIGEEIAALE